MMFRKLRHTTALLSCAFVLPLTIQYALAQNAQDVQVALKALRVTVSEDKEDKKETLVAADQVKPGDVIEYQATYTNTTARSVRNLQATLPIPATLEYVADTAKPTQVWASLDGKTFQSVPLMRKRVTANGQQTTEAVPLREYRFLRWNIGELGARKSVVVMARAKVAGGRAGSAKTGAKP